MNVSHSFREISYDEAGLDTYALAWMDPAIPRRQLALVEHELLEWAQDKPMPLFDTLRECLRIVTLERHQEVLEIGCGVGHNSVVARVAGNLTYTGIDYNPRFIELAREKFQYTAGRTRFEVMDALTPSFPPSSFDVVLHSACLMHVLDWRTALSAAASLSRSYLILHRTPISRSRHPRYFIKEGYGVEMFEQWFSEHELFDRLSSLGFELKRVWTTSEDLQHSYHTYLLQRTLMHHPV